MSDCLDTPEAYTQFLQAISIRGPDGPMAPTLEHAVHKLPEREHVRALLGEHGGLGRFTQYLAKREELIYWMEHDPLDHGYEWDWYSDARWLIDGIGRGVAPEWLRHFPKGVNELVILAGNNTGKSWFGAKWACERLRAHEEIDFIFGHMTEDSSKDQQQQIVHRFLPRDWKAAKRGTTVDLSFRGKAGFTDNKFVVNQRRGLFMFYKQEAGRLTGYKVRGVWADELITLPFLEELRARLLGREGKLLITFTPVDGYTPAVGEYLAGSEIVAWKPSKYLSTGRNVDVPGAPPGHMPYILRCRRSTSAVLMAFSEWNPFIKLEEIERLIEGKSRGYIKQRLYGWPEKQGGMQFSKFGTANIIRRARDQAAPPGMVPPHPWRTLYPTLPQDGALNTVVIDPAENKNWFIKWYRHTREPLRVCVYREWPDLPTCGEWALPGDKHDGVPGPAQRFEFGHSVVRYKALMLEAEGWVWDDEQGRWDGTNAEKIFRRMIDPRFGGSLLPSTNPNDWAEGRTDDRTIIQWLNDEQVDPAGRVVGPAMEFLPAPGDAIQGGLQRLLDYMDYKEHEPVTAMNAPRWFVCEDCGQSVYAYRAYTGLDGQKGALKDVIDPDRYFAKSDVMECDDEVVPWERLGGY